MYSINSLEIYLGLHSTPDPVFYVGRRGNGMVVPVFDRSHGFLYRGLMALSELKSLLGQMASAAY